MINISSITDPVEELLGLKSPTRRRRKGKSTKARRVYGQRRRSKRKRSRKTRSRRRSW